MSRLEHLVPPPAVLLITLIAMFVISRYDQARDLRADVYIVNSSIAIGFAVAGIAIVIMAIRQFRATQTTINPLKPHTASNLVTTGVFRFTRNPMYLGMVFVALGSVAYYGSAWCVLAVIAFVAYITRFQIIPEERAMLALFGHEFEIYKTRTRRWI